MTTQEERAAAAHRASMPRPLITIGMTQDQYDFCDAQIGDPSYAAFRQMVDAGSIRITNPREAR